MTRFKTTTMLALMSAFVFGSASLAGETDGGGPDCWLELNEQASGQILSGYAADIQGARYQLTTRTRGAGQVMDSDHAGPVEVYDETRIFTIAMTGSIPGRHRGEVASMPAMSRFMRSLENRVARASARGRPNARVSADLTILDSSGETLCTASLG